MYHNLLHYEGLHRSQTLPSCCINDGDGTGKNDGLMRSNSGQDKENVRTPRGRLSKKKQVNFSTDPSMSFT